MPEPMTLEQAIAFFRSVILSGESWTDECERVYAHARAALTRASLAAPSYEWASDDPQYLALEYLRSLRNTLLRELVELEPQVDHSQEHAGGYSASFVRCEQLKRECAHVSVAITAIDRPALAARDDQQTIDEERATLAAIAQFAKAHGWTDAGEAPSLGEYIRLALAPSVAGPAVVRDLIADIIESVMGYTNGWHVSGETYRRDALRAADTITAALAASARGA